MDYVQKEKSKISNAKMLKSNIPFTICNFKVVKDVNFRKNYNEFQVQQKLIFSF